MDGPIRRSILHRNTVECDQQWRALLHKQIWEADAFEGVHEICVWIRGVCDWVVQNS